MGISLNDHRQPMLNLVYYRQLTEVFFAWATAEQAIKMARLKAIIAIILLVGRGECARDLTKCVVCKKTLTWS